MRLPRQLFSQILSFYRDQEYFTRLFQIVLPLAVQNLVMSTLGMVGSVMIGQLGETAVAAVGLSNQIFFLLNLALFGITSGAAMFTAQLWGKGDLPNLRRVLGLSLLLSGLVSASLGAASIWMPEILLGFYTADPAVITLGSSYLRIFGWSFLFTAVSFSFAAVLRSTGEVRLPLVVSLGALALNTLLSYLLIFGKWGLPTLGVEGAATAILIARIVESLALVLAAYALKTAAAASWQELFRLNRAFISRVLKPMLPVMANEVLWALGITLYSMVYARMGTDSIAAMNIVSTIDNLGLVIFFALGSACAILIGNQIGAGREDRAFQYAVRTLGLGIVGALIMGGVVMLGAESILGLYKVSPVVLEHARRVIIIIALLLWLRVSNVILFVGVFRSGGDTRFALLLDAGMVWAVGVPMALLGGFVFHLPVHWVYLMVMLDEFAKWLIGMWRLFSRRWIHNLSRAV